MIQFKDIEVNISGYRLLCQNAIIDSDSTQNPYYALNFSRPVTHSPGGLKSNLDLEYLVEPGNEPNFYIISGFRTPQNTYSPFQIIIGGITGYYYLNNLRYNILPNDSVRAAASYTSYSQLSGSLVTQYTGNPSSYNSGNSSGIAHYWSTIATIDNQNITGSLLQAGINIQISYDPIYILGSAEPCQVSFLNMREDFDITTEIPKIITFNTQLGETGFLDFNKINLYNISYIWATGAINKNIEFSLTGAIINGQKIALPINDIITVSTSLSKYY